MTQQRRQQIKAEEEMAILEGMQKIDEKCKNIMDHDFRWQVHSKFGNKVDETLAEIQSEVNCCLK